MGSYSRFIESKNASRQAQTVGLLVSSINFILSCIFFYGWCYLSFYLGQLNIGLEHITYMRLGNEVEAAHSES